MNKYPELIKRFNFHNYDSLAHTESSKFDPRKRFGDFERDQVVTLLFSAKSGDLNTIRRIYMQGGDLELCDYDKRTALHLAASEGYIEIVKFLINIAKVRVDPRDRWNRRPQDAPTQGIFKKHTLFPVFVIMGERQRFVLPLLDVLLPSKSEAIYTKMWEMIRTLWPEFKPTTANLDYEVALMNSLKTASLGIILDAQQFGYPQIVTLLEKAMQLSGSSYNLKDHGCENKGGGKLPNSVSVSSTDDEDDVVGVGEESSNDSLDFYITPTATKSEPVVFHLGDPSAPHP
uniref:Uncharacterized protein n=1 Tax=Ditylenchus dipsaci TaxID=166011 RepID=A0A915DX07_9BILA